MGWRLDVKVKPESSRAQVSTARAAVLKIAHATPRMECERQRTLSGCPCAPAYAEPASDSALGTRLGDLIMGSNLLHRPQNLSLR